MLFHLLFIFLFSLYSNLMANEKATESCLFVNSLSQLPLTKVTDRSQFVFKQKKMLYQYSNLKLGEFFYSGKNIFFREKTKIYDSALYYFPINQIHSCEQVIELKNQTLEKHSKAQSLSLALQGKETWGSAIIKAESILYESHNKPYPLKKNLEWYNQTLTQVKEAISSVESFRKKLIIVRKILFDKGLANYCRDKVNINQLINRNCTNCQGQTLLIMAIYKDLKLETPLNSELSIQVFNDHIRPILYFKDKKIVLDLVYHKFENKIIESIYNSNYLLYLIFEKINKYLNSYYNDMISVTSYEVIEDNRPWLKQLAKLSIPEVFYDVQSFNPFRSNSNYEIIETNLPITTQNFSSTEAPENADLSGFIDNDFIDEGIGKNDKQGFSLDFLFALFERESSVCYKGISVDDIKEDTTFDRKSLNELYNSCKKGKFNSGWAEENLNYFSFLTKNDKSLYKYKQQEDKYSKIIFSPNALYGLAISLDVPFEREKNSVSYHDLLVKVMKKTLDLSFKSNQVLEDYTSKNIDNFKDFFRYFFSYYDNGLYTLKELMYFQSINYSDSDYNDRKSNNIKPLLRYNALLLKQRNPLYDVLIKEFAYEIFKYYSYIIKHPNEFMDFVRLLSQDEIDALRSTMVYFDSLSEYVYKSHFFGDYDAFLKTYKTFPTEILSNIYPDEGLNGLLVRKIFTQKQFVYTLDKDSEIEQQKKSTPTLKKMVEVLKRKHSSKNKETFKTLPVVDYDECSKTDNDYYFKGFFIVYCKEQKIVEPNVDEIVKKSFRIPIQISEKVMRHILLRFISIESFNPDEVWYFVDSVSNNWLNSDFFSYYLDGSTNGGKHLKTLMIMSRLPYFSHFDLLKSESNCGENSQWKQCFYNYTTKLIIDNDISQLKPWILNDTYQLALLLKAKNFQNKKIINLFYNLEGNDKDKAKLIKNTKNINNLYDFVLNFEIQFYDEKDQYTYHRFEMDKNTRLVRGLRNLNYNFIDRFDFNFLNKRNVMFIKFFDQSAAERILNTMELF